MTIGARRAEPQPQHGHPGVQQFRAAAVRADRPRRRRGARRHRAPSARAARCRRPRRNGRARAQLFTAHRVDDEATRATIAETWQRTGELLDPHSAVARGGGAGGAARPGVADGGARLRPSGEIPRGGRAGDGSASGAAAALWPISCRGRSGSPRCPTILRAVERLRARAMRSGAATGRRGMTRARHHARERHARRSPTRWTAVETVSLGVWVDVGTRHEPAEINGVAHLLEHMAFKGTDAALARSTSPTRSRRSAAISTPIPRASTPPITPRC